MIDVTEAGMDHMSYSDVPLLSAFGNSAKEEVAIRCFKDLASVAVAFFDRPLTPFPSREPIFARASFHLSRSPPMTRTESC
jgi:hypothetical protein